VAKRFALYDERNNGSSSNALVRSYILSHQDQDSVLCASKGDGRPGGKSSLMNNNKQCVNNSQFRRATHPSLIHAALTALTANIFVDLLRQKKSLSTTDIFIIFILSIISSVPRTFIYNFIIVNTKVNSHPAPKFQARSRIKKFPY